jgi:monoamine oxidase
MSDFDAVIIGAGAAGIAAARRLRAAGRNVVLVEARNRVGGRCALDLSLGVPADVGAAWLHFARENVWTTLAEQDGFTIDRRPPGWGPDAWVGNRAPTPAERALAAGNYRRYEQLIAEAAEAGRDVPLTEVLPDDAFRPRFDAVMTWAMGVESRSVSTLDYHRYADSDENWSVREGLGAVVAAAAIDLPVSLGVRATRVDWGGERVKVDTTAGRIEADAAIVTLPTAVLAHGSVEFDPPLPDRHREAIEALPLGVCNKVFFRLRSTDGFVRSLPRHFIGAASTSRTCSWETLPGGCPLLMAYFGGDLSAELEKRGELVQFARDELKRCFGAAVLRELDDALATAWGSDPFSRGSYSAARPGHADARSRLAEPVSERLHLAGEACAVHHYGTLHGAWLSGVAAAERLL